MSKDEKNRFGRSDLVGKSITRTFKGPGDPIDGETVSGAIDTDLPDTFPERKHLASSVFEAFNTDTKRDFPSVSEPAPMTVINPSVLPSDDNTDQIDLAELEKASREEASKNFRTADDLLDDFYSSRPVQEADSHVMVTKRQRQEESRTSLFTRSAMKLSGVLLFGFAIGAVMMSLWQKEEPLLPEKPSVVERSESEDIYRSLYEDQKMLNNKLRDSLKDVTKDLDTCLTAAAPASVTPSQIDHEDVREYQESSGFHGYVMKPGETIWQVAKSRGYRPWAIVIYNMEPYKSRCIKQHGKRRCMKGHWAKYLEPGDVIKFPEQQQEAEPIKASSKLPKQGAQLIPPKRLDNTFISTTQIHHISSLSDAIVITHSGKSIVTIAKEAGVDAHGLVSENNEVLESDCIKTFTENPDRCKNFGWANILKAGTILKIPKIKNKQVSENKHHSMAALQQHTFGQMMNQEIQKVKPRFHMKGERILSLQMNEDGLLGFKEYKVFSDLPKPRMVQSAIISLW